MKRILLSIVFFLSGILLFAQQDSTGQAQLFDFWLGNWDATWDEADGKKGKGTNLIEKILDGKVLQENFMVLKGQSQGFKGVSISVFNPQSQEWKQSWADNQGGYYAFRGRAEGEKRIFQTDVVRLNDGRQFTQRMVFKDITPQSMTWDWESSGDGGKSWTLNWRIFYTKKTEAKE